MKQKTGKKLLSFLLTLAMVVGLMPGMSLTALADGAYTIKAYDNDYLDIDYGNLAVVDSLPYATTAKDLMKQVGNNKLGSSYNMTGVTLVSGSSVTIGAVTGTSGNSDYNVDISITGEGESVIQVTATNGRGPYNIKIITTSPHSVTLTGGANATPSGGDTSQTGLSGAMTTVTYTANDNYNFPETSDYYKTTNGITVARTSDTVVTVSGTPTADTSITIPDAVVAHTHSFTYSASGAVITATCDTDGCGLTDEKATLTLTAPTLTTYDETGKSAVATLNGLDAFKAATSLNVAETDIKYVGRDGTNYAESTKAPTNAGKYTAKSTLSGVKTSESENGSVTASLEYAIAQATTTVTTAPTAGEITYGDTLSDSALTGGAGSVAGSFAWKDSTIDPAVSDSQKTEYDVVFTPDDGNYATAECKVKLTVNKAAPTVTAPTAKTLTYTGSAQALVNAGSVTGGTLYYAVTTENTAPTDENLYTTSIPSKTDVGTYYVWYKVNGDANHNNTEPDFVEAKINPVDKAELNKAIKEAEDYYNIIKDNPAYSEQAKALSDAIKAANELADNKNAKDNEVSAGITAVTEAKKKVEAEVKDIDDAAAAKKVTDAINAIPTSDKVATTDKAAIEAARKAYDALSADQKAKVPADTLKKLTDAEKALVVAEANDKAAKELAAAKQEAQASMNEQVTVTQKGNKFTVKWKKSSSADGYYVYASYCGKKAAKPAKTIKKNTTTKTTITKINGKKINQKKNFHVYVVPYKIIDGKKVTLGKSTVAHLVGAKNTKYSNVKKLTLTKKKYTVKVGKTAKIKAKVTLVNKNKKHISTAHGAKFRYKSSDTSIATVDKNGKIKGIKKGTCTIYVYAINGLTKKAKVTVK